MNLNKYLKFLYSFCESIKNQDTYKPVYRVIEIFQGEENNYFVKIQIINKSLTFKAKPEEILANDNMVDQFSPRDIRTLTYLGYLDMNSPKYKILAKRLSENSDKLVFALKQRGNSELITKTAEEIFQEKAILKSLYPEDAHIIGYTCASENIVGEKEQKRGIKIQAL